ncbi:hypothetical protein CERSUDRAFT_120133 [Gelatoporia subvermispora B]|uniref:Uncharacterized protein n=1 Tax=Ceriporiopsis subvermispora (strain B) TaxID=914234 RepID=M2QX29_CERS8|nr:hypothetical protein CERSUDRAFT_120133 [Gelatoporia subvermispora B]
MGRTLKSIANKRPAQKLPAKLRPDAVKGGSPNEKVEGMLRHLSQSMRRQGRIIWSPGRLSVEVWYLVTDHLSEVVTLRSLGMTCKILLCLAKEIIESLTKAETLVIPRRSALIHAHRRMLRKPLAASFVRTCEVSEGLLVSFLCHWAGRLPNARFLHIMGSTSTPSCPSLLRTRVLSLAVRFGALTELRLSSCSFRSFHEFLRLICAFPNLRILSLLNSEWIRDSEEPEQYAQLTKRLHLKDLKISDSEVSKYRPLLALHVLHKSIASINIQGNSNSQRPNTGLFYQAPGRVSSSESPSSTPASPRRSQNAAILIAVDKEHEFRTSWMYECSDILDSFVDESISACVIEVEVRCGDEQYQDLPALSDGSLVLPRLRARGTLRVLVDESLEHPPVLGYQRHVKFR